MPPESLRAQLSAGAEALGWPLSDVQAEQMAGYLGLLAKWNKVYNLTAIRDPAQMVTQHLMDSLAVVPPLARHLANTPAAMLDVGSGGGLPGVVAAIALPRLNVTCVDAVAKKASFVRQVAGELRLTNLSANHARVEALQASPFEVVTSRAFSSLADLISLTRPLLAPGGVWMAMKGRRPDDEVALLPGDVEVFHVEHLHVPCLDAERCLVWMRPR